MLLPYKRKQKYFPFFTLCYLLPFSIIEWCPENYISYIRNEFQGLICFKITIFTSMVKSHLWQQRLSMAFQMYGLKKHATTSPFLSFCFSNIPRKQVFILTALPKPDFWMMKTVFARLLKIQQRDWLLLFRTKNTEVTFKIFYFSLCFKAYKILKKKIHSNMEKKNNPSKISVVE